MSIQRMEVNRLIKEVEYLKADYNYKSDMLREISTMFLSNVDRIINSNSELKSIYEDRNTKDLQIEGDYDEEQEIIFDYTEERYTEDYRSDKLKKLYREIVKLTHPDKISNKSLNGVYIQSTNLYEAGDIAGIISLCDYLSIKYDIDSSDIEDIKHEISIIRDKIIFIESAPVWEWHKEVSDKKDKLVLEYIRNLIINT